ncbi:MAG: helicase associated domain-containing protein [Cryobacterium sp.]|nr:helicase associated domain-containing protein [Cryobacterium sp.]
MHRTGAANRLIAEYSTLAAQKPSAPGSDDERSLRYFAVEDALRSGRAVDERNRLITDWVDSLLKFEVFAHREGRLPRENNRLARDEISETERTLTGWSRYQRRPAARAAHCRYQALRLESIPGFRWDPLEQQWRDMCDAYFRFVALHGAPALRRPEPHERSLAGWAARQRRAHALGNLSPARVAELNATRAWTWTPASSAPH